MNSEHEGRLPYAEAAHKHNLVVSPYLFPESFKSLGAKTPIAIEGLSDDSLENICYSFQTLYDFHPRFREMGYLGEHKKAESTQNFNLAKFFLVVAAIPFGLYALAKNQGNSSDPVNKCTDLALKTTEAEISAQFKGQAANATADGITISYKKTSNEFARAVELCTANEVKDPGTAGELEQVIVVSGMTIMFSMVVAFFAVKASKLLREANCYKEKAKIMEGDTKIVKDEIKRRGLSLEGYL